MMIQGTFAVWTLCWPEIPVISATRQAVPAFSRQVRPRAITEIGLNRSAVVTFFDC